MDTKNQEEKIANTAMIYAIKGALEDMALSLNEFLEESQIEVIYRAKKEEIEEDFEPVTIKPYQILDLLPFLNNDESLKIFAEIVCSYEYGRRQRKMFREIREIEDAIESAKSVYVARADNLICLMDVTKLHSGCAISFGSKLLEKLAEIVLKNSGIEVIPYYDEGPFNLLPPYPTIIFDSTGVNPQGAGLRGRKGVEKTIFRLIQNAPLNSKILILASDSLLSSGALVEDVFLKHLKKIETLGRIYWPQTGAYIHLLVLVKGGRTTKNVEIVMDGVGKRVSYNDIVTTGNLIPARILANKQVKRAYYSIKHSTAIRDIAELIPSAEFIIRKNEKSGLNNYKIVRLRDVHDEILTDQLEVKSVSKDLADYTLKPWDLVVSVKGDIKRFRLAIVPEDFPNNVVLSSNLVALRFKEKEMAELVKIFLESPFGRKILESKTRGGPIPFITKAALLGIRVPEVSGVSHIIKEYNQILTETQELIKQIERKKEEGIKKIYKKIGIYLETEEIE